MALGSWGKRLPKTNEIIKTYRSLTQLILFTDYNLNFYKSSMHMCFSENIFNKKKINTNLPCFLI